jgi:hypothetical protein
MQNSGLGQDTVVPIPGYSAAAGITRFGPDQVAPFHTITEPPASEARQKVADGHEIESSCPLASTGSWPDHGPPMRPAETPVPFTMKHSDVVGQAMAVGSEAANEVVHGAGCCVQEEPFQPSTELPTTAVHEELVGQEIPTLPSW